MGYIGLILLVVNIILLFFDLKKGIYLYFLLSIVAPVISIGDAFFSYDLIAFIPLVCIYLLGRTNFIGIHYVFSFWLYFVIVLLSSVLTLSFDGNDINFIGLFGIIRFVCLMTILADCRVIDRKAIKVVLFIVITICAIFSSIQLTVPQSVDFFHSMYWKPSAEPLNKILEAGFFNRAIGCFYTPTILGAFSLFTFTVFFCEWKYANHTKMEVVGVILSFICGMFSLSKMFFLGVPAFIILDLVIPKFLKLKGNKINGFVKIIIASLIFVLGYFLVKLLLELDLTVEYYANFILNPLDAFETRYDAQSGILTGTYNVMLNNPILGVGAVLLDSSIFIGDSSIVTIFLEGGILGSLLWIFVFAMVFVYGFRKKQYGYPFAISAFTLLEIYTGSNVAETTLGVLLLSYSLIVLLPVENEENNEE